LLVLEVAVLVLEHLEVELLEGEEDVVVGELEGGEEEEGCRGGD
jgi:hypothetical protein